MRDTWTWRPLNTVPSAGDRLVRSPCGRHWPYPSWPWSSSPGSPLTIAVKPV